VGSVYQAAHTRQAIVCLRASAVMFIKVNRRSICEPSLTSFLPQAGRLFEVSSMSAAEIGHRSARGELEEQHCCLASAPELPRPVTRAGGAWSTTTPTHGEVRDMPRERLYLPLTSQAGNLA